MEQAGSELRKFIPRPEEYKLAAWIFNQPLDPLAGTDGGVWCWFKLLSPLEEQPGGVTAKQLARRLGLEGHQHRLADVLERLADRGEVQRTNKGAVRYQTKPLSKVLAHLMRQFPKRLPAIEHEAFELAVLTYQDAQDAESWGALVGTLVALVKAVPCWPEQVSRQVEADPALWLRLLAGVEPPSYKLDETDQLVTELRAEIERLKAENLTLAAGMNERQAQLDQAAAEQEDLRARVEELEAWWDDFATTIESPSLADLLDGNGRGALPDHLPDEEVARIRGLLLDTKADRSAMLAIAAALGTIYSNPTGHQRLTTLSFKEHPFDSLWRCRAGKFRIVYGLLRNQVHPIIIATRGEVYELTVHALRNRRF
jgi:mRNA-degrading endonuclease RelE of RelBE toxin-antitoxin system